ISGGGDHRLRIWDLATGNRLYSYDCGAPVLCIAVRDGLIAAGTAGGKVLTFDLAKRKLAKKVYTSGARRWYIGALPADLKKIPRKRLPIVAIAFGDNTIHTVGHDGVLRWYSLELERRARVDHAIDHEISDAHGIHILDEGVLVLVNGRLRLH